MTKKLFELYQGKYKYKYMDPYRHCFAFKLKGWRPTTYNVTDIPKNSVNWRGDASLSSVNK